MSTDTIIFGSLGLLATAGCLFFLLGVVIELQDRKTGRTSAAASFLGGAITGALVLGAGAAGLFALAASLS